MKYTAIGFDWGGVLNGKPGTAFNKDVANLLGITEDEYLEAYFHHNKKVNRGEVSWEELWKLVLGELGQPDKLAEVLKMSEEANADSLNQDVLDIADKLRQSGYKVGLLSNNSLDKAEAMRKAGLDHHFDVFHISAETGFVKPEPKAFNHLADELGVPLSELIFIDDSKKSLSTAAECGFAALLFENSTQLLNELKQLGVSIS